SLGIGPLVTASIVLQLLTGSGILKIDLTSHDGKRHFQGLQKILSIFFVIFEAAIYVFMGGLAPPASTEGLSIHLWLQLFLVFQLFIGGVLIMFMDEVVSKWGFGSGISLFIAAGVSESIFIRAFSPLPSPTNPNVMTGAVPSLFQFLASGDATNALLMFAAVAFTVIVFLMAVYAQAMKVEIPLSFGRIRGHGIRWPLSFIYTSNIPVILVAALLANLQLWAMLMQNWGHPILGTFTGNTPSSGLVTWLFPSNIVAKIITQSIRWIDVAHALVYILFMVVGAVIFSYFWVQTSGMDARSQAKQMMASGLQIPGFRRDERVLERLLDRYIMPLTIMGAIAVGILAALADLSGALSNGTGILLTVMIIYRLYEDIARQHMMDMNPMLRKFMGGS
ncbi:MAG TPA: preprotein translocase subunit SecY, partial [Candidatus Nanoarchaeia archaeon]|nr:preprotein translocase subunit SecY [Candidatus Nanoarchaeia archaeon]